MTTPEWWHCSGNPSRPSTSTRANHPYEILSPCSRRISRISTQGVNFTHADLRRCQIRMQPGTCRTGRGAMGFSTFGQPPSRRRLRGVSLFSGTFQGADLRGRVIHGASLKRDLLRCGSAGRRVSTGADFSEADLGGRTSSSTISPTRSVRRPQPYREVTEGTESRCKTVASVLSDTSNCYHPTAERTHAPRPSLVLTVVTVLVPHCLPRRGGLSNFSRQDFFAINFPGERASRRSPGLRAGAMYPGRVYSAENGPNRSPSLSLITPRPRDQRGARQDLPTRCADGVLGVGDDGGRLVDCRPAGRDGLCVGKFLTREGSHVTFFGWFYQDSSKLTGADTTPTVRGRSSPCTCTTIACTSSRDGPRRGASARSLPAIDAVSSMGTERRYRYGTVYSNNSEPGRGADPAPPAAR